MRQQPMRGAKCAFAFVHLKVAASQDGWFHQEVGYQLSSLAQEKPKGGRGQLGEVSITSCLRGEVCRASEGQKVCDTFSSLVGSNANVNDPTVIVVFMLHISMIHIYTFICGRTLDHAGAPHFPSKTMMGMMRPWRFSNGRKTRWVWPLHHTVPPS